MTEANWTESAEFEDGRTSGNSVWLLYTVQKPQACLLKYDTIRKFSHADFSRLFEAWEDYLGIRQPEKWSQSGLTPLRRGFMVTPEGYPYEENFGSQGAWYNVFTFRQDDEATVEIVRGRLKDEQGALGVSRFRMTLMDWNPPAPFERVTPPSWMSAILEVSTLLQSEAPIKFDTKYGHRIVGGRFKGVVRKPSSQEELDLPVSVVPTELVATAEARHEKALLKLRQD